VNRLLENLEKFMWDNMTRTRACSIELTQVGMQIPVAHLLHYSTEDLLDLSINERTVMQRRARVMNAPSGPHGIARNLMNAVGSSGP
jgi:hypothetical protein